LTEPELEPTNLSETVVRGVGLAGAGYVFAQVVTLGFYLALARLASPQDFGEFAAGSLLVQVGLLFTESGMMAALIHREDRIDEAASTAVIATATAGLGFALLAVAAAPALGAIFGSTTVEKIGFATSGLLFVRSLQIVPEALLQRRFSFLRRVIVEPAGAIALGIGAVIACSQGLGPWGLVIGYYCAAVTDVVLSWALVGWRPKLAQASFAMWRELVRYGRFVVGATALMRAGEQIPVLLIGRFVGANALGQYRYASRIISTPLMVVVQGASYVLFPALARITGDRDRFRAACLRSLALMCAVAFPLGLILVPLGVPAATLLFGEVWRDAGYAAMAMAAFPVAGAVVSFASEVLKADGRPDVLARVHVVILVCGAIAMVALLPFDLVGVAAGLSLGTVGGAVYSLFRLGPLLGIPRLRMTAAFLPQAAAALLMAAVLTPVEFLLVDSASHGTALGLVLAGAEAAAGFALYALALYALAPATARDLATVIRRSVRRLGGPESDPVEPATVPAAR